MEGKKTRGKRKLFHEAKKMCAPTHMEINGNTEAVVEGCRGILEYDDDVVRIRTAKVIVTFSGRGLSIRCMTADSLVVEGFITGINFTV